MINKLFQQVYRRFDLRRIQIFIRLMSLLYAAGSQYQSVAPQLPNIRRLGGIVHHLRCLSRQAGDQLAPGRVSIIGKRL